jgi:hypothetical protein
MDDVEKIINEIKDDNIFQRTWFSSGFLKDTAEVFEKYGFGETKIFLEKKRRNKATKWQAQTMLNILNIFDKYPRIRQDLKTGSLIIQTIDALKRG